MEQPEWEVLELVAPSEDVTLVYLMDPHCGWCFGYGRTIAAFYERVIKHNSIAFKVLTGGLFIPRIAGSAEFADDKRSIAARVEHQFGVSFSPNYFDNVLAGSWIDSTPSSRAIHTCEILDQSSTLQFAGRIVDAAFLEARNISLPEVVLEIAEEQGFDSTVFRETMASPSVTDSLDQSLRFSAQAQTGFPAVFLLNNKRAEVIHVGGANLSVHDLERAVDDHL